MAEWRRALALCACTALLSAATPEPAPEEQALAVLAAGSRTAEALGALAREVLARAGVRARPAPAPADCDASHRRADACLNATLRALVRGVAQVALVELGSRVPPALLLRDAGLEELGDLIPPERLACQATGGAARSLLDLSPAYRLDGFDDFADPPLGHPCGIRAGCAAPGNASGAGCPPPPPDAATLLVDDEEDAAALARVVCERDLPARVAVLGPHLASTLAELGSSPARPAVFCSRDPSAPALAALGARLLGPPPCETDDCPFEPRRLVKLVNARELTHSPTAYRVIGRLSLDSAELRELRAGVRAEGVEAGAREFLRGRPAWARPPAEVRVAVMVPADTRRETQAAVALGAAAELAELDLHSSGAESVRFKAELAGGGCTATAAFKYLTDALGSEYGALSAVAGPLCGTTFTDVARQSPTLVLPVLAYTPQAPPPGAAARLALLVAGDARAETDAWGALLAHLGWRRLAVLSELATRPALDTARLHADVVAHVELAADGEEIDLALITEWAERAARAEARVLLVSAEDARVVRAALCAGARAGLRPRSGTVWLLPGALPAGWLRAAPPCDRHELADQADGHLSFVPEWLADWENASEPREWDARWREACLRRAGAAAECLHPPAAAALLYDALQLWAAALRSMLTARPAYLDDLHRRSVTERLVEEATSTLFVGLTGRIEWVTVGGARARSSPLVLLQRGESGERRAGRWEGGILALPEGALAWRTADGRTPDDGGERCALQPVADLLDWNCRTAFAGVATLVLVAAVSALAGGAWQCKRRVEREYRARLAELGLRAAGPEPDGLDRWEVPRERVVINRKLGAGAFGTVYGGHAMLAEGRGWTPVAVKTLKAGATTEDKLDFLSEAETMKRFDHKNVVRLLGVVTKSEPVCTVMELMLFGDMKSFLVARRQLAGGEEVDAARLTSMALDAARALSYLAQQRCVHRDVAARNCLVSASRVVKLADFGMTRLVFENDYYRFSRKGLLPVRWMAPESLALGVFSAASDVWSFGVLLYEMVTFGALPYQGLSNSEVLARVKSGRTLHLPLGIKPQLEGLIKSCWVREPRARPAAADVAAFLAESPRLLAPCPDMPPISLALDVDAALAEVGETRWAAWAAAAAWAGPASAGTDTTYLSADGPRDTDAFLP